MQNNYIGQLLDNLNPSVATTCETNIFWANLLKQKTKQ